MEKLKVVKLSVIIPVYNVEKYLKRCLDSVINQTLKDIEILCINDGSTDDSLSILEEYKSKDSRIVIISQGNKGLAATRNVGIENAKGEYLAFVDSDDWINSKFLECLYSSAKEIEPKETIAKLMIIFDILFIKTPIKVCKNLVCLKEHF